MIRLKLPGFALLLTMSVVTAHAEDFVVGTISAARGELTSGFLDIPAQAGDEGSEIPITVVHGAAEGPVLALIAGTHGYEYPGITALQEVRKELEPARLAGTIIMVHVANMPSFLGRTIYYSPADGKNLNRVYPGDPAGTVSQRIAHQITTQVIDQSDYLIDLHAGDGNEALRPYIYMPVTGNAELDAATRGLALAFGLDTIVIDDGRAGVDEPSLYTDQTALVRGIPAITTETGQSGSNDSYWVGLAKDGVWNVLRHLQMVAGEPVENTGVTWLGDYQIVRSPHSGIFRAATRDGYRVAEGALLGELVDFFGDPVAEIRAPFSGVVNYVISTPPVSEGEPVAMLSKVREPGT